MVTLGATRAFEVYDPARALAKLPAGRHHLGLATLEGRVYASGGYAGMSFEPRNAEVWAYDPARDGWAEVAPMPAPRAAHAMVALGGRLYVVGGVGPGADELWSYDPEADAWRTDHAPLPTPREHLAAAALGGKLYVLGGRGHGHSGNRDTVESYDPAANAWTAAPPMPTHDDPDLCMVESADVMDDPAWRRGYALLGERGLSFDHGINYLQLDRTVALLRALPDTACVINHLGYPSDRGAEAIAVWRAGMREVAAYPSAWMKMSGIFMTDHDWTVDSIRPFVLEAIEAFGPARCMFGSNFPVDKLYGGYAEILGAYQEVVKDFSENEQRQLFHDTAASFYRV